MGDPRMDDDAQRRLCDGLTGAACVAALAGLAVGHWRGALLAGAVAVIAQLIRVGV